MRKTVVLVLVNLALAHGALGATGIPADPWPNGWRVSTNVGGMVLTLEFADMSVAAGDRLDGRMIVANGTQSPRYLDYLARVSGVGRVGERKDVPPSPRDTAIGQFVVEDDERNPMPKISWRLPGGERATGGGEGFTALYPGDAVAFHGDLVKDYSVTNPGIYLVKAVATVGRQAVDVIDPRLQGGPMIRPMDGAEEMIIETPIIAVTVLPRPASMPPPAPLYSPRELANILKDRTPPFVMRATHPKPERPPQLPRVAPREVTAAPLPVKVQEGVTAARATGEAAKNKSPVLPSRGVLFALIAVLLSGGLVVYLVWSRRKHGHP